SRPTNASGPAGLEQQRCSVGAGPDCMGLNLLSVAAVVGAVSKRQWNQRTNTGPLPVGEMNSAHVIRLIHLTWVLEPPLVALVRSCPVSTEGAGENLLDHRGFRIGVVLRVLPRTARKLALGALVERAIGGVAAQMVAEAQHPLDLHAARREDMKVDV